MSKSESKGDGGGKDCSAKSEAEITKEGAPTLMVPGK